MRIAPEVVLRSHITLVEPSAWLLLREKLSSSKFPRIWNARNDTNTFLIYDSLFALTPAERLSLSGKYEVLFSVTLDDDLKDKLDDDEYYYASALAKGDKFVVDAARLGHAMKGLCTTEEDVWTVLEGKTSDYRLALAQIYKGMFKEELTEAIDDDFDDGPINGLELSRTMDLLWHGGLDPVQAVRYASEGWGTDKSLLMATLQHMSLEDQARFQQAYGESVEEYVDGEMDGRDFFDAQEALLGNPQNLTERLTRLEKALAFERAEWTNWGGNALMYIAADDKDTRLVNAVAAARQYHNALLNLLSQGTGTIAKLTLEERARIDTLLQESGLSAEDRANLQRLLIQSNLSMEEDVVREHLLDISNLSSEQKQELNLLLRRAELERLLEVAELDLQSYRVGRDSGTEIAVNVVTTLAIIGAVVLTGGLGAPAAIPLSQMLITGVSSAVASQVLTRYLLQGEGYAGENLPGHIAIGVIDGVAAAIPGGLALSPTTWASKLWYGVLIGSLSGGAVGLAQHTILPETWANGPWQGGQRLALAGAQGFVFGGLFGGALGAASPITEPLLAKSLSALIASGRALKLAYIAGEFFLTEELPTLLRASRGAPVGFDHLWKRPLAIGIDAAIPAMVSGVGDSIVNGLPNLSRILGKVPQALKTALQNAKDKVLTEALVKAIVAELKTVIPNLTDDQARLLALAAVQEAKVAAAMETALAEGRAAQAAIALAEIEKDIVQYLPSLKRVIGDEVPDTLRLALLKATKDNTPLSLQGLTDELRKLRPILSERELHFLALEAMQEARVARGMAGAKQGLVVSGNEATTLPVWHNGCANVRAIFLEPNSPFQYDVGIKKWVDNLVQRGLKKSLEAMKDMIERRFRVSHPALADKLIAAAERDWAARFTPTAVQKPKSPGRQQNARAAAAKGDEFEPVARQVLIDRGETVINSQRSRGALNEGFDSLSYTGTGADAQLFINDAKNVQGEVPLTEFRSFGFSPKKKRIVDTLARSKEIAERAIQNLVTDPETKRVLLNQLIGDGERKAIVRIIGKATTTVSEAIAQTVEQKTGWNFQRQLLRVSN